MIPSLPRRAHLHTPLLQLERKPAFPQQPIRRRKQKHINRRRKQHNQRIEEIEINLCRRNRREIPLLELDHAVNTAPDEEDLGNHGGPDDGRVGPLGGPGEVPDDAPRGDFVPDDEGEEETEGGEVDGQTGHEGVFAGLLALGVAGFV